MNIPDERPWVPPDERLVADALAGNVHHGRLSRADRAWLVAYLTHRGHTNADIAAWLRCSPRTVQMVRGEPVAVLTMRLLAAEQERERP